MKNAYKLLMLIAVVALIGCGGSSATDAELESGAGGLGTKNISGVYPEDGAVDVDVGSSLTVTFDTDIDESTINDSSVAVSVNGVSVAGTVSYDAATRTLTFTPTYPLISGATYEITISGLILAKMAGDLTTSFTTHETPLLYSSTYDPANPAEAGARNLWSANKDTSGSKQLTSLTDADESAHTTKYAWSPDDKYIAYVLTRNMSGTDYHYLMVMGPDGSDPVSITADTGKLYWDNTKAPLYSNFEWAPDASKIYALVQATELTHYEVYSFKPDGMEATRITKVPADTDTHQYGITKFRLSPDGTKIVYYFRDQNLELNVLTYNLYLIGSDGTGSVNITGNVSNKAAVGMGRFSPDGKKVFYTIPGSASKADLVSYDIAASTTTNITNLAKAFSIYNYDISPDGKRAAAIINDGDNNVDDLYLIDINSGSKTEMTNRATNGGLERLREVYFSPDGKKIVYMCINDVTNADSDIDLYVITSGNSVNTKISNGKVAYGSYQNIMWSPDGSQIALNIYNKDVPGENMVNMGLADVVEGLTDITDSSVIEFRLEDWW